MSEVVLGKLTTGVQCPGCQRVMMEEEIFRNSVIVCRTQDCDLEGVYYNPPTLPLDPVFKS